MICLLSLSSLSFAAGGDTVQDKYNAVWQIAASGLNTLLTKMDGLPDAYQATQSMNEWTTYIRLEYGQSGSINKIFPLDVYTFLIGRFVGYNYGNTEIYEDFKPPVCSGGVGEITCDEDTVSSRDVLCYLWDFVDFTELAAGNLVTGTWTFSSLSVGSYVCTFNSNFDALPTIYLVVTE